MTKTTGKGLRKAEGEPYVVPKFHELWYTKAYNWTGVLTHPQYYVPSPVHRTLSSVNVVPHGVCKRNAIVFVCSSDSKSQNT